MSFIGTVFGLDLYYQLLYFGAKINHLIVQGQYWRLFTAMFLHIGIMHLFFNSYALYVYGSVVEKLFGRIRFVLIYTIAGLTGSLLSFLLSRNPAVGASGAIFGLMDRFVLSAEKTDLYRISDRALYCYWRESVFWFYTAGYRQLGPYRRFNRRIPGCKCCGIVP